MNAGLDQRRLERSDARGEQQPAAPLAGGAGAAAAGHQLPGSAQRQPRHGRLRRRALGDVRLQPGLRAGHRVLRLHGHLPAAEVLLPLLPEPAALRPPGPWSSSPATGCRARPPTCASSATATRSSLRLDGRLLERQATRPGPDRARGWRIRRSPSAPAASGLARWKRWGTSAGRPAARHAVRTPGAIERLTLAVDLVRAPAGSRAQGPVSSATPRCATRRDGRAGRMGERRLRRHRRRRAGRDGTLIASEAGIASILAETESGRGSRSRSTRWRSFRAGRRRACWRRRWGWKAGRHGTSWCYTTDGRSARADLASLPRRGRRYSRACARDWWCKEGWCRRCAIDAPKFRIPAARRRKARAVPPVSGGRGEFEPRWRRSPAALGMKSSRRPCFAAACTSPSMASPNASSTSPHHRFTLMPSDRDRSRRPTAARTPRAGRRRS